MKLHLYQYGHGSKLPGISIGVARLAPRGIRVEDRFRKGYFQVWMPLLAPSKALFSAYRKQAISHPQFAQRYIREMKRPESVQAIRLIAAICQTVRVNLGCFCPDDSKCHRSLLADLVRKAEAELPAPSDSIPQYFSSPCSMPEIEDD